MMKRTLAIALLAACCSAQAQVTPPEVAVHQKQELRHGDPARWSKPDRTQAQQMATLRKEINAALAEAKAGCKQLPRDERSECMKEAQATYIADISNMREQIANANNPRQGAYDTSGQ
jgi:membrane-bound lytic murein transglycosylase B